MKAQIGISEENSHEIAALLNRLLANEFVLYTKTRNYHWNVEGENFGSLHLLFETQYRMLEEIIDSTAERIRVLGHYAEGRLKGYLDITDLIEQSETNNSVEQIKNLLNDHETVIRYIRNEVSPITDKYHDVGTADFVTALMEQHEKTAWMLRSHLK